MIDEAEWKEFEENFIKNYDKIHYPYRFIHQPHTMNSKELRIGNFINDGTKGRCDVRGITKKGIWITNDHGVATETAFTPIPLTENWLVKLSFVKTGSSRVSMDDDTDITHQYDIDGLPFRGSFHFNIKHNTGSFYFHWTERESNCEECVTTKIYYVHQLQNLYFALTGQGLTLKTD